MDRYDRRMAYDRRQRRRKRKRTKIFTNWMRKSLLFVFFLFFAAFAALMFNIYRIDRDKGDRYRKAAFSRQAYTNTILNYQRGTIFDRNNTALAVSIRKYNLVLEPRTLLTDEDERKATVNAISKTFDFDKKTLEKTIDERPNSMYERFEGLYDLDAKSVEEFQKLKDGNEKINGVWFEETYKRNYPLGAVGCSVIGFLSSESEGVCGVEMSYNNELSGTTGREYGYFDSNMDLQRTIKEAKDGNSLVLTLDANVQKILEEEIADFQENGVGAKRVAVMVMNPNNGEILAMASDLSFDLNNPQDMSRTYTEKKISEMDDKQKSEALAVMWSNFCIASAYEPGSTFKPMTVAAALDENLVGDGSYFRCSGGKKIGKTTIRCNKRSGHGSISLRTSLMESCNCALMTIGARLGRERFSFYNNLYGFGQRTGIDLPGETSGLVFSADRLNPVELATSSFGQTQTVTMVQMLSAFSSLINGGKYYQPHIVKEIQNSSGDTLEKNDSVLVKTTTTEETSSLLCSYLKSTVEKGTASPAKIKGYSIGGKTGTAQKHEKGRLTKGYLLSFIGCVPAEDPELAYYVIVDEPNVEDQAHSTYATELSSKIMKRMLPFLGQYTK